MSRGTGREQRELINYSRDGEDKRCSQDRPPDTSDPPNDDSSDELDGECQIPIVGYDITAIGSKQGTSDASEERREDECTHFRLEEVHSHNSRTNLIISYSLEGASST